MAKIRKDYENSWWPRFLRWLSGGSTRLDNQLQEELVESSEAHLVQSPEEAAQMERQAEERVQKALQDERNMYDHVHQWAKLKGTRLTRALYSILAVVTCFAIIYVLLRTTSFLPPFGNPDNPVNNEVSQRYIEQGMQETGAVNIVAGMILDYRAFDTLGESNVLFIAACSVLILLRISREKDGSQSAEQLLVEANDRMYEPKNDTISPGGGFSGGALMGAALILYLNAFGFKKTERFFTFRVFQIVSLCALSFYAVSKAYSFFTGANHLWSFITPGTPGKLFSAGLIPYLNLAVGLVVCCTMYAFYTLFRKGDM